MPEPMPPPIDQETLTRLAAALVDHDAYSRDNLIAAAKCYRGDVAEAVAEALRPSRASWPGGVTRRDDPQAVPPIGYEARCERCGESFNPAGPADLIHVARIDGEPCGGQGDLLGEWRAR